MFSSRLAAAVLAALLAGCASPDPAGVPRLAILPFDNQTPDPALDRLGADLARAASLSLGGSTGLYAFPATDSNDAALRRASLIVNGYLSGAPGSLRLAVTVQDTASGKITQRFDLGGNTANARVSLAPQLARRFWPDSPGLGTTNENAASLLLTALAEPVPAKAAGFAAESLAADPGFTQAAIARAEFLAAAGDEPAAKAQVETTLSQSPAPYARARLDFLAATLSADPTRGLASAAALARLSPADSDMALRLAQTHLAARDFPGAAAAFERVRSLEPANTAVFNQLLYTYGYAGDFDKAQRTFDDYQKIDPRDPNPLDSLGEVYFMNGRFADAEARFLALHQRNQASIRPPALYKAAVARLLSGDRTGAMALFDKLAATMPKHPLTGLVHARWEYLTGRKAEAMTRLEALGKDGASLALSQLALFRLHSGADARPIATAAVQTSRAPQERILAMVVLLAVQPDAAPDEWRRRIESAIPARSPQRDALLGEILFVRGHFEAAIPALERVLNSGRVPPANRWEAMLAKALTETGKSAQARAWLRFWPLPPLVEDGYWDHLILDTARSLRATP